MKALILAENDQELKDLISLAHEIELTELIIFEKPKRLNGKIITTLNQTVKIISAIKKEKPKIIITGAQVLHQRIALLFKDKNTKTVTYNRGLLGDIDKSPIKSLKILTTIPAILRKIRPLNPFLADYSLVINKKTKKCY